MVSSRKSYKKNALRSARSSRALSLLCTLRRDFYERLLLSQWNCHVIGISKDSADMNNWLIFFGWSWFLPFTGLVLSLRWLMCVMIDSKRRRCRLLPCTRRDFKLKSRDLSYLLGNNGKWFPNKKNRFSPDPVGGKLKQKQTLKDLNKRQLHLTHHRTIYPSRAGFSQF